MNPGAILLLRDKEVSERNNPTGKGWVISSGPANHIFVYAGRLQDWSVSWPAEEISPYPLGRGTADITWATRALEFTGRPTHGDLVEILRGITQMIAQKNVVLLADTLERLLKDQRLRLDVMIAALRGSFPAKSQFQAKWRELLVLARQRIIEAGRNPESLLRGL